MEQIAVVKVVDLRSVLNELKSIRSEVKQLKEQEDLKSYSVQQTANKIGVSYNTVRKLIKEGKLYAKYVDEVNAKGKCTIPAWSIKEYLSNEKNVQ
jgi:DNA-directed RNA polymerase specialized sigma24 family protein